MATAMTATCAQAAAMPARCEVGVGHILGRFLRRRLGIFLRCVASTRGAEKEESRTVTAIPDRFALPPFGKLMGTPYNALNSNRTRTSRGSLPSPRGIEEDASYAWRGVEGLT